MGKKLNLFPLEYTIIRFRNLSFFWFDDLRKSAEVPSPVASSSGSGPDTTSFALSPSRVHHRLSIPHALSYLWPVREFEEWRDGFYILQVVLEILPYSIRGQRQQVSMRNEESLDDDYPPCPYSTTCRRRCRILETLKDLPLPPPHSHPLSRLLNWHVIS